MTTPSEKALRHLHVASRHIVSTATRSRGDARPANLLVSDCNWKGAMTKIDAAINELNLARQQLQPLAENRPRVYR